MKNRYFKLIVENNPFCILLIGVNHKILAFNEVTKSIIREEFRVEINEGDTYYPDLVEDSMKEMYLNAFNSALNGFPYNSKYFKQLGNSIIWRELKTYPVFEEHHLIGVIFQIEDITDLKELELKNLDICKKYKAIIDNTSESITLLDTNFKILALNQLSANAIEENTSLVPSIGSDFRDYIMDDNSLFYEYYTKALQGESNVVEIPYQDSRNQHIWYQTTFNPVYYENKLIGVSIFAKDFTTEKNIELLLIESEKKLKIIVENSPIGKFMIQKGKLIFVNKEFEKMFGYTKKMIANNMSFEDLIHKDDLNKLHDLFHNRKKKINAIESNVFRVINKNGNIVYVELYITLTSYNDEPTNVGTLVDVTQRIGEEDRTNKAIIETQEKERLQIGMELHDNVKQILSGFSIYLDVMQKKLDDKEAVNKIICYLKKYNNEAITELRRLSHQLAPLVEDDTSLKDKIDSLVQSLKLHDTMAINLKIDELLVPLDKNIQLVFYRILQEQFSNILRYSKASKVDINIKLLKGKICFSVIDNGVGFDVNAKKQGIGLENIRRRVKTLNGSLEIISSIGKGSEIKIGIPVKST